MPPVTERVLVISPVFNEAEHLRLTAASVAAQTRRPDEWRIVDDGSTDGTYEIAVELAAEHDFVVAMRAAPKDPDARDRLAVASEARAFNHALAARPSSEFTHIGKLDGDLELPPEWFATLLQAMRDDPSLGLVGGRLAERSPEGWAVIPIPDEHIHGAVKLYRRECLEAIGGIEERLAWDTIDETYARMRGYGTLTLRDLVGRHFRPYGSANGRLRGKARHGECAWVLHQSLPWVLGRSVKLARVPPVGASGAAFVFGYLRAAARRTPQVEDREFKRFVRRELRARMLTASVRW